MDKKNFAEPGFMLAAADTVVLIGVIVYFQSQIVRLKEQIAALRCQCSSSSPSAEERAEEKFLLRQLSSRLDAFEARLNTMASSTSPKAEERREEEEEEEEDPVMKIVLDIANRPTTER